MVFHVVYVTKPDFHKEGADEEHFIKYKNILYWNWHPEERPCGIKSSVGRENYQLGFCCLRPTCLLQILCICS